MYNIYTCIGYVELICLIMIDFRDIFQHFNENFFITGNTLSCWSIFADSVVGADSVAVNVSPPKYRLQRLSVSDGDHVTNLPL